MPKSGAAAAERSAESDTAPRATAGGWLGREQTPDERVGNRQPQTSDHYRLQLQDAQTQNVRSVRWFPVPEFPNPKSTTGTEFGLRF